MSIVEQITRIQTNIANAYSSCEAKGATLPEIQNSDNLASVIDSISGSGGGSGGVAVGGEIEVINKTGANIAIDDKVWINEIVDVDWSTYAHTYLNELSVGNETSVDLFRYDFTITELDSGGSNYTGGTAPLIKSSSGNVIGVFVNGVNYNNTIYLAAARGNGSTWNLPSNTGNRITASLGDKISVRVKNIPGYGAYIIIYNLTTGLNTGTMGGENGSIRLGTRDEPDLLVRMSNTWSSTFKLKFVADRVWFSKGGLEVVDYNPDETSIKQFWAVPFKNFNDKTLTGVAKTEAEDNQTLTAIIGGDVTEVYNQDKTITENGTYTADDGYTGLGTVTVNVESSGGDTITAVNKTGKAIATGDKVWLNENAQTQGSSYEFDSSSATTTRLAVIDTIGTFAYKNGKFYSINNESATYVGDSNPSTDLALIRYGADGSVFGCGNRVARVDGQAQWWSSDLAYYVESGWAVDSNKLLQFDMVNGTVIKTLTFGLNSMGDSECIKIGDYIYRLNNNARTKYLIDYDNLTLTSSSYTFTNPPYQYSIYPLDKTADNKYILCNIEYAISAGGNSSRLYIVEVLDDGNLRGLSQSEMPVDLQKWYSTACGYNFNPYTGILTVYEYEGADYGIYRYEGNGTWTQLPIDLGITENISFRGAITISNDLSRACYNYYRSSGSFTYMPSVIVNLTTTSGYAAVPYKSYNVTENTITGYAGNDAEADGEVVVGIASVPGSTPSVTGGSDTFEAQLILDNVVNSGTLKTEEEAVNETVAVLKDILGE